MHHQIEGGRGKVKDKAGGTQLNLKRTPDQANHPTSGSVTIATNPGTLLENAEHPSKLGVDKHKYRTTWIKMKTFHACSRRSTPLIYSTMCSKHLTLSHWNRRML